MTNSTSFTNSSNTANNTCDDNENGTNFILVEIVSALNVPNVEHPNQPDPYVVVEIAGQRIHQTEVLHNTQFPVWSLDSGSLFLIERNDQIKHKHVQFILKEYERIRADPTLGTLQISLEEMLKAQGQRSEFPLEVPQNILDLTMRGVCKTIVRKTRLVLRFKPATAGDVHFIQTQKLQKKKAGLFAEESYLPPVPSTHNHEAQRGLGSLPPIDEWGATLFGTADSRATQADLSPDPLLLEAMKPSKEWITVGDPNAKGKVYVEILACNGLPNLDMPSILKFNNLTDAFCCLVMEDSIVNTSIIPDNLSPRWMPTSDHRAFVFGVQHPSSHLYVGVFNHNSTAKMYKPLNAFQEWTHTPVGRVLINLTQLKPDTIYTLHFHLFEVSCDSAKNRREGNHNGTLIIRLRIEWDQQVLAGMRLPPEFYVSVPRKHDFQTAIYTTVGERGSGAFSMTSLTSYVEELQAYATQETTELVIMAALTVLLWRGTHKVNLLGRDLSVPLHSIVAFTWGVLVTQNYNRFPSCVVFAVAWFFLVSMEQHKKHPSPWQQCESYSDLFRALGAELCTLCMGRSSRYFFVREKESIAVNQNILQIQPFNEAKQKLKDMRAEVKLKQEKELEEEVNQHEAEMAVLSEANIATAKRETLNFFSSVNPLKPILHPLQNVLHQLCIFMRVVQSIVSWEENYYPFWIVTACLLISALIFFVPWGLVLRWVIRILVWVALGPWMRCVDWYYFEQIELMTSEEKERYVQECVKASQELFQAQRLQSRTERGERAKLKSMMIYFFGKYVVQVPRFQTAQFLDHPLPASTADPYEDRGGEVTIIGQVCGQTLTGSMIPSRTVQTQPFLKEISHERPSERLTERFTIPPQEVAKKSKKKKRLSFKSFMKKLK